MDMVLDVLLRLLSGWHLFYLLVGVSYGLLLGLLPGLGGIAGLALLLPFIYGMDPGYALAMMIGMQSTTTTSDTFPAVLMGVPGSSAAQATVVDGFPLAKRGQAARALSAAFSASLFGGIFGAFVLSGAVLAAIPVLRLIGFGEQMMLMVIALSMVGVLTGGSPVKGLSACCLGLMLGSIGSAPSTGAQRLTFGLPYLIDGVQLSILGLGMFAIPEIVELMRRRKTVAETNELGSGWLQGFRDTLKNWSLVLRCSALGAFLGALPGIGGAVIDWIAYGHVVQTSRDKSQFGKGDIRGVIAPESATQAKEGGALIPTLLLGIPGTGGMALLLAAFVMIGIRPGVEMVTTHLDMVFLIIWSVALANIFGTLICLAIAKPIAKMTLIPLAFISPIMFVLIFFASLQATRDFWDVIALLATGVLGIYLKRFGWSRPALLVGFILSNGLESGIYRTVQVYGYSFLERPIVIGLLLVLAISVYSAIRFRTPTEEGGDPMGVEAIKHRGPQLIFLAIVLAFMGTVLVQSLSWQYATALYPRIVGVIALIMLVPMVAMMLTGRGPKTLYYDAELGEDVQDPSVKSDEHYIAWLASFVAGIFVFGFTVSAGVFVLLFLRLKAEITWFWTLFTVAATLALLQFTAWILSLEYPIGILREWWLGWI